MFKENIWRADKSLVGFFLLICQTNVELISPLQSLDGNSTELLGTEVMGLRGKVHYYAVSTLRFITRAIRSGQ